MSFMNNWRVLSCGVRPRKIFIKISCFALSGLLLQACGSSDDAQQAEAPTDYPDYQVPEEATNVPDDVEPYTPKWYVERYKVFAIKEMKRTGIPASITLAQGMLESSYGKSKLAKEGKNHFGIKCHRGNWGGGEMYLADDRPDECFRTYESVLHSYKDHSEFLRKGSRYEGLFELKPNNYADWAEGLKEAGYATNPRYDDILIKLIKKHNLHYFDQYHNKPFKGGKLVEQRSTQDQKATAKVNGLEAYKPEAQQSLKAIAQQTGVAIRKLKEYNDFHDPYATVQKGIPIYLSPKNQKPAKSYHVVEEKESLWEISQKYGVQLKKLYKRNRLDAPNQPPVGKRVFLRKVRYSQLPEREESLVKPEKDKAVADKSGIRNSSGELPRFHGVQEGETMNHIAELYDIPLPKLYKLNRLEKGQQPAVGAKIHLKETRYVKPATRKTENNQQSADKTKAKSNENQTPGKPKEKDDTANQALKQQQKEQSFEAADNHQAQKSSSAKKPDETNKEGQKTQSEQDKAAGPANRKDVHIVQDGETLFGIARQYSVTVDELKKWNNLQKSAIHLGQALSLKPPEKESEKQEQKGSKSEALPVYHTVKKGETLFGIAQQYNLSTKQLKKRNKLSSDQLDLGQKIRIRPKENNNQQAVKPRSKKGNKKKTHTVQSGETLFGIAQSHDVTIKALKKANDLKKNRIQKGQELIIP